MGSITIPTSGAGSAIDIYEAGSSVVTAATRLDFKDAVVQNPSGTLADVYFALPSTDRRRLTTQQGVPVSTADRTSQGILYWTPFFGPEVSLYDGSNWWLVRPPEIALNLTLTSAKVYDVFGFLSSLTASSTDTSTDTLTYASVHNIPTGSAVRSATTLAGLTANTWYFARAASSTTITLHSTLAGALANTGKVDLTANVTQSLQYIGMALSSAWTNDTTRADALTTQDFIKVKSGATNHRLIGKVRASGTNVTEESDTLRGVTNYQNRVSQRLRTCPGYNNDNAWSYYTLTNTTYAAVNGGTGATVGFLTWGDRASEFDYTYHIVADGPAGTQTVPGLGCDSTTDSNCKGTSLSAASGRLGGGVIRGVPDYVADGYHTLTMLAMVPSGTGTIWSDGARYGSAADPFATYGIGWVLA